MRIPIVLLLFLAVNPAAKARVNHVERTITVGSNRRSYILEFNEKPKPTHLLLAFHGGGDTADAFFVQTAALRKAALAKNFAVAYPQGWKNVWEDGRPEKNSGGQDVEFVRALTASLTEEFQLAPGQAFAVGYSNGGGMVYRLGCELAGVLSGGAAIKMLMAENLADTCKPMKRYSLLILVDRHDPVVISGGGIVMNGHKNQGRILSTAKTADFWRKVNAGSRVKVVVDFLPGNTHEWPQAWTAPRSKLNEKHSAENRIREIPDFFLHLNQ